MPTSYLLNTYKKHSAYQSYRQDGRKQKIRRRKTKVPKIRKADFRVLTKIRRKHERLL